MSLADKIDVGLLLFLALVGLYSPVAAVASYIPLLRPYSRPQRLRIALGLFLNVTGIVLVTILIGEPLLIALGLTTAALSATGGIALMYEAVPLMLGKGGLHEVDVEESSDLVVEDSAVEDSGAGASGSTRSSWRSAVFYPFTFPLTIGGATVGLLISFRAEVHGTTAVAILVVAALAYALVTGLSVYIAGHAERFLSERARSILDRVAGILLVAIASTLLASGFTRLVVDVLHNVKIL